jgi:hypothetical protein
MFSMKECKKKLGLPVPGRARTHRSRLFHVCILKQTQIKSQFTWLTLIKMALFDALMQGVGGGPACVGWPGLKDPCIFGTFLE